MADFAGIAGRVDFLANADAAETLRTSMQVFQFGFHLRQTFDDRPQMHP
ncbi:hypothetical protein [Pseudomonas sp. H2_D02]